MSLALDADQRSAAAAALLAEATTSAEANAVTRTCLRAGYLWRCPTCRADQYANRQTCNGCQSRRPDAD